MEGGGEWERGGREGETGERGRDGRREAALEWRKGEDCMPWPLNVAKLVKTVNKPYSLVSELLYTGTGSNV